MTAETQDYSAMSARELDAAVAERVMGYSWEELSGEYYLCPVHPKRGVGKLPQWRSKAKEYWRFVPCFSKSLSDAMLAAERMREQGWHVELVGYSGQWIASMERGMDGEYFYAEIRRDTLADLPRAICIACLCALDAAKGAGE